MTPMLLLEKQALEKLTTVTELLAQLFGILAVFCGAVYFLASKPLKKIEAEERLKEREAFNHRTLALERAAADATAAQQRVEIELNEQRERAATAEKALLEVQRRVSDRTIPPDRRDTFIRTLREEEGSLSVVCTIDSLESCRFASELVVALREAGWNPKLVTDAPLVDDDPRADRMNIVVKDLAHIPRHAVALQKALVQIGFDAPGTADPALASDGVILQIKGR